MRPRIVDALNLWSGTSLFSWLVPDPAFLYALAIGSVLWVFVRRATGNGLAAYHALGGAIWAIAAGMIGARAFFVLQHFQLFVAQPSLLLDLNGATVSWGAYLGGATAFFLYLSRATQAPFRYADILATCLGLGVLFGRIACFLNGDDYGTLSDLPWAVAFPHGSYPFADQANAGLINPMADLSLPVHPVQLYLALNGLLLFLVFSYVCRHFRPPDGVLFFMFWATFSFTRFLLEFFRGDASRGFVGPFSVGQAMCAVIFCVSVMCLTLRFRMDRNSSGVQAV